VIIVLVKVIYVGLIGLEFSRFMFTDLEPVDPGSPTRILEKIFVTPKDYDQGTPYSLVD
jgi:hypothetical protein